MATPMLNCCSFQKGMYLPNGVGPTDSCPPIIQTVADILDAVAGTVEGQLTVERYVGASFQHIHLYSWDGFDWKSEVGMEFTVSVSLIKEFNIANIEANWEVSIDSGANWVTTGDSIIPPVAVINVWFRNTVNNCIYSNIPQIPLQDYCTDWVVITLANPSFFELFGTVNGVTPPVQATILATMVAPYQGVQGAVGGVYYNGDTLYLQVSRPSDKPVTASLATVLDENSDPIDTTPSDTTCDLQCYTATGVAIDAPSTYSIDGVTINGVEISLNTAVYVTDASVNSDLLAAIQAYGYYDPTMSVNVYTSGQNMVVTIQSVLDFTGNVYFNADNPANSVNATMTTCI